MGDLTLVTLGCQELWNYLKSYASCMGCERIWRRAFSWRNVSWLSSSSTKWRSHFTKEVPGMPHKTRHLWTLRNFIAGICLGEARSTGICGYRDWAGLALLFKGGDEHYLYTIMQRNGSLNWPHKGNQIVFNNWTESNNIGFFLFSSTKRNDYVTMHSHSTGTEYCSEA